MFERVLNTCLKAESVTCERQILIHFPEECKRFSKEVTKIEVD